jgi:hypothetical protein
MSAKLAIIMCISNIVCYTAAFVILDSRVTALEKRVTTLEKNFDGAVAAMQTPAVIFQPSETKTYTLKSGGKAERCVENAHDYQHLSDDLIIKNCHLQVGDND